MYTASIVHDRLGTVQLYAGTTCTMLTEYRVRSENWAPVICALNRLYTINWARFSRAQIQVCIGTIGHAVFRATAGTREFRMYLMVHYRLTMSTIQLHTSATVHEHKYAPYRLSASTTLHRNYCTRIQLCTVATLHSS